MKPRPELGRKETVLFVSMICKLNVSQLSSTWLAKLWPTIFGCNRNILNWSAKSFHAYLHKIVVENMLSIVYSMVVWIRRTLCRWKYTESFVFLSKYWECRMGLPRIQSLFKWRLDQNSDIAKIYELHNTQYKRAKHTCGRHETKSDEIRTDNQPDQKAMRTPLDRWIKMCLGMKTKRMEIFHFMLIIMTPTSGGCDPSQKCYKMVDYVSDSADFCLKCVKFMNYRAGIVNKPNYRTARRTSGVVSSVRLIKKTSISSLFGHNNNPRGGKTRSTRNSLTKWSNKTL